RPLDDFLAHDERLETRVDVAFKDRKLVVPVTGQTLDLFTLDLQRTLVLVDAVTVKDPDLDHGAIGARRQTQRRVAHVGRLFTKDSAQKLFFRRHRAFALGRDLANQNVARADLGADIDDASLIKVAQRLFTDVRDVAGDLFRAQLGIAGR